MIKAIIAVVAVIAAFGAGLAGVYFAMPTLAPEKVERAQVHLDSLALVDSLARVYGGDILADSTARPPDSLATTPDSLATMPAPPDSLAADAATPEEAQDEAAADTVGEAMLRDSLATFQRRFEVLQREQKQLLGQVATLSKQLEDQQAHQVKIQKLNSTLGRLEDKELAGVIKQLDVGVLEVLYMQASAHNRARLLEAMSPQVAAGFVRRLVQPNKAAVTETTAPPDTVASAPASGSEPESLNQ